MRKLSFTLLLALASICVSAKSVRELFVSMPNEMIPYLNENMRTQLVDFANNILRSDVINQLGDTTIMHELTDDFVSLTLSPASKMQIKRLPSTDGDSIVCVVQTYFGPCAESNVTLFTQNWQKIDDINDALKKHIPSMIVRPDTMSVERFDYLRKCIEPVMMQAELKQSSSDLVLSLSAPLLFRDDKNSAKSLFLQRNLKWNGKSFE